MAVLSLPAVRSRFPAMLALVVSGCATLTAPLPALRPPDLIACGAVNFQYLVGQGRAALEGLDLPEPRRIIRPGQVVTLDYNATRLNLDIDESRVITRIWCG